MSLRKKFLLLTVSMIVLPVLAMLAASEHFSRQTFDLSVQTAQGLAASDLEHIVSGALNLAEANENAMRLQRETAVKNYLRSMAEIALAKVRRFHENRPAPGNWENLRRDLLEMKVGVSGYVFAMDSAGVLKIHPNSEGRNLAGESHIDQMIREKEGFITYYSVTAQRNKAVYFLYYEPLDLILAPGVFIDELTLLYDEQAEQGIWDKFLLLLNNVRLGSTGSVWIMSSAGDAKGTFVLPPKGLSGAALETFPAETVLDQAAKGDLGVPVQCRLLVQGEKGPQPFMAAVSRLSGKGWIIGATIPEQEMLASSKRIAASFSALKLSMIGVAAIAILLAAGVAILFAGRALGPLKRGVEFSTRVAEGDLTATLPASSGDEVGRLIDALKLMVEGIRSMVQRTKQTITGLDSISTRLTGAADNLDKLSEQQAQRAEDTAAAIQEISVSLREVDHSVVQLGEAAAENTASILELSSSIEEVALNMQAVNQAGQEVSAAATQMAATSRQIAESTRHLEEAAGSTASSIFQMDAGTQSVQQHASNMAQISQGVLEDAREGKGAVESTAGGIRDISSSMGSAADVVQSLAERTKSIGNIVSVIGEVASEIDLLALNAAIIAAQAGAEGRGFAVVAEEIKELAGRTTLSTREIAEVVNYVQGGIDQASRLIGVVAEKTTSGVSLAEKAGEMLVKIVEGVEQVSHGVGEVAAAMSEQASGSQAIKQATETVSNMVGQIVQATTEQEKASQDIQASAERLKSLAEQVTNSTREQSKTSGLIARNTEGMNDMIRKIGQASSEQVVSSELIVKAGEDIRSGSQTAWQANQVLLESVKGLVGEIETLEDQVALFRTENVAEEGSGAAD